MSSGIEMEWAYMKYFFFLKQQNAYYGINLKRLVEDN